MGFRRGKVFLGIFLILFFVSFPFASLAAEDRGGSESTVGYATRCLNLERIKWEEVPEGEKPSSKKDHILKLTGKDFSPYQDVYIVGCVTSENGYVCSGGSEDEVNEKLQEIGFAAVAKPSFAGGTYEFELRNNPVKADGNGNIQLYVRSATPRGTEHRFFGVIPLSGALSGSANTVQYGQLIFTQDPKECAFVRWDPTGKVFDAKSLEPLPDVTVKILDSEGNLLPFAPGFNPVKVTEPDGEFSFFVPEGVYKIGVEKPGYSFPVNKEEINSNFSKIYRCDSQNVGPGAEIYDQQYEIRERAGTMVRCDIPMMPLGEPYRGEVVIFDYGHMVLPSGRVVYSARFSHPLAIGILKREDNGLILAQKQADKNGAWQVELPKERIPQDTALVLEVKKVDLTNLSKKGLVDKVLALLEKIFSSYAKTAQGVYRTSLKFEPILPYIEGYIYDDQDKVLPNAKVKIVLRSTGNVLLQAQTDENGFIRILPEYLPSFPYYIQVEKAGKIYAYTTSSFVRKNKPYLQQQKLDLSRIEKAGKPLVFTQKEREESKERFMIEQPKELEKESTNVAVTISPSSEKAQAEVQNQPEKKFLWGMIGLLVVFLLATGAGIIFYLRSRRFNY